mgnify:CR=1 FL=1
MVWKKTVMRQVKEALVRAITEESDEEVIGLYEYWIAEGNSFSR